MLYFLMNVVFLLKKQEMLRKQWPGDNSENEGKITLKYTGENKKKNYR